MAEEKKGFILYSDIIHTIQKLTDQQAGVLFKHILKYVNDENPECKDLITEIAFEPIKQSLKRDLLKWGDKKQKRSDAGIAGATKRWQNIANDSKRIKPIANIAVSVNDNVNVNVINKIEARSQIFKDSLLQYKNKYQVNMLKEFYNYWTEPNQSKSKMRFELEKTWSVERRLETWAKRENSFNVKPQIKQDRL